LSPETVKSILNNIISELHQDPSLFVARPGIDFTRDRKLPLDTMLKIIIGMNGGSIKRELYDYDQSISVTSAAFVQQRDKILPDMFGYIRFWEEFIRQRVYTVGQFIQVSFGVNQTLQFCSHGLLLTIACFQHWILTYSCPLGNISGFHPFLMYLQKESEHFQIGQEIRKTDMFDRAGRIINIVVCNDDFSIRCRNP